MPDANSSIRNGAADNSLRSLLGLDWPAVGLPPSSEWDASLLTAVRLITFAAVPMKLLLGANGILVPNAPMQALFPGTGVEIARRSVFEVSPENAAFYSEVLARVLAGEACSFREQPITLVRGGERTAAWFDLEFMPVTAASGGVVAVLGIASEVTAHVQRVRRLSESEQRLRLALESSGMVGIWTLDVETNTSTADANVARTFGLSASDCLRGVDDGLFIQAIHAEDRSRVAETLRSAIESRTPYRCRYRVLSHDGHPRWVITSGKPSYGESGQFVRLLGVVIDVTDQMETASALAESRFQFETLTEALPQIVWSCNAEGQHDYFSARWSEFTGISKEGITEDTWKQLVYPDHWPLVSSVWEEARRNGKPYDLDYRFRHHSGEYRWLRVMALPIRDGAGRITRWFGTSTDVHDAYLVSEEREGLARELERVAAEDQLTGVLTRRAFLERAASAIEKAAACRSSIGLLMMDIDHFKSINDSYGHPGGDQVLAVAAKRIRASVNKDDLVGRLGGEEFAVLLPGCTPRQARDVAERIRRSIREEPIALERDVTIPVTLCVGVTTSVWPGGSLSQMLLVADKALYEAKASGRNRSVFFAGNSSGH